MSTRRARIKSVAAIPVRKKPVVVEKSPLKAKSLEKVEIQANPPAVQENVSEQETTVNNTKEVQNNTIANKVINDANETLPSNTIEADSELDPNKKCIETTAEVKTTFRRRTMKPMINIPSKKRKVEPITKLNSPIKVNSPVSYKNSTELITECSKSPSLQPVVDINHQETSSSPCIVNAEKSTIYGITPLIKPIDRDAKKSFGNDSVSSSPSPLSTECNFDPIIPLPSPSPSKNRFKLRPAPLFSPRRNSIHDNELDDDLNRTKNRSDELRSSVININIPSTPNSVISNANRNRNDSICSLGIDASVIVTPRPKKLNTSTENTKRSTIRRRIMNREPQNPLTMSDLIYYNPPNNAMKSTKTAKKEEKQIVDIVKESKPQETNDVSLNTSDASAIPVPQVKLGPNGEIVIDEQSLVIETTDAVKSRTELSKLSVVYESGLGPGSGGIYRRASRSKDWSHCETLRFYKALNTIGTDFALMLSLFPGRTRKDLKVKFKREEKHNLKLVNKALLNPLNFDITELEQQLSNDQKAMEQRSVIKKMQPKVQTEPKQKKKYIKTNISLKTLGMEPPEKKPRKNKSAIEVKSTKNPPVITSRSSTSRSTNSSEIRPKRVETPLPSEGVADVEPGSMIILVNQVPSKPGFNTLQAYIANKSENSEMTPINLEFKMLMSIAKEMNILKPGQKYIPVHHDKNVSNLLSPIHSSSM